MMLLTAGILTGVLYWNVQLSFGVMLPEHLPYCTGSVDAPDRGVYVLLNRKEHCPDLNRESLYEYMERKKIPFISVVSWYNSIEEFNTSNNLAEAYCPSPRSIQVRWINYSRILYCFVRKGTQLSLRSFMQVRPNAKGDEKVNIEFSLNEVSKRNLRKYWRIVESLTVQPALSPYRCVRLKQRLQGRSVNEVRNQHTAAHSSGTSTF